MLRPERSASSVIGCFRILFCSIARKTLSESCSRQQIPGPMHVLDADTVLGRDHLKEVCRMNSSKVRSPDTRPLSRVASETIRSRTQIATSSCGCSTMSTESPTERCVRAARRYKSTLDWRAFSPHRRFQPSSSSNAFASFKSFVSKPSVNQL